MTAQTSFSGWGLFACTVNNNIIYNKVPRDQESLRNSGLKTLSAPAIYQFVNSPYIIHTK